MRWNNVSKKFSEDYDIQLMRGICTNSRKTAITTISEEFPEISRTRIAATVDRCLLKKEQPVATATFLNFMQSIL